MPLWWEKKNVKLHERGFVGIPVQSLHAPSKNLNDSHMTASRTTYEQQQLQGHI